MGSVASLEAKVSCRSGVLVAYAAQNISDSFPRKYPGPGALNTRLPFGDIFAH